MTGLKAQTRTRSRRGARSLLRVVAAAAWLWPASALAQGESTTVRHFIDRSERIPLLTAFPKYPAIARRDRIEGEATVCFTINANGRVLRPEVTTYSHKVFSKAALRAARDSKYEPLAPGQFLDPTPTCRIYRFRLDPVLVSADEEDSGAAQ